MGYIYIRNHSSYDEYNACKMGKTFNIPERDIHYATGEIKRGYFEMVFEVPIKEMGKIECLLQNEFSKLNIKYDAGTEFYNKKIINLIEPILISLGIKYKKLSKEEINNLVRCKRIKSNKIITITFKPRDYQNIIIDKSVIHFQQYDKGMLVLMCGVGKTLISLWITQKLNSNTILIGVPNKLLLKQWKKVICELFKNKECLMVSDKINIEKIKYFLKNYNNNCIIITTYSSAFKVYIATQQINFNFDMKILDEVHHLTTKDIKIEETTKKYIEILNIPSIKQLSLTATIKQLENINNDNIIISNDNIEYFGEIIDKKCLLWAINKNIICDYIIQTFITNEEQLLKFNIIEENSKRLFLSSLIALKSIFNGHSHHLLIYSNNKNNSLELVKYIKNILDMNYFNIPELYYSNYHSEMTSKNQKEIINNFEKAKFGIITCVYCLGEGWDFPLLDGVVFAENMTSNIRIVQSALRASRKNKNEINKKTKIILPILNTNNLSENPDLKKIKEVIYQMSLEDETIAQKINIIINNPIDKQFSVKKENNIKYKYNYDLIKELILKTVKRISLTITYEKARKIISNKNIKNKENYFKLCEIDNRLSKEPEIVFKEKFTNWIEYLGIERIYYDLEKCKNKVNEYLLLYPEIKKDYLNLLNICNKLCKIDELFPPYDFWVEYYNINNLQEIINIKNKKKKIGVIL